MFPFLSNLLFCPVTLRYENVNFPISSKSPAHCCTCSPVPRHRRAAASHRDPNSGDLESCRVPPPMWKQFSSRSKVFFLPKLCRPINIQQKCILSLFAYSLLNTIMVSSCIAGGSIHWNFTVDFIFSFIIVLQMYFLPFSSVPIECLMFPITPVFYYFSSIILIPHLLHGI